MGLATDWANGSEGMDKIFQGLENAPLAERAREAILGAILAKRFERGRLPSEDELARMLNVSRTTIRTALHGLEQDGIITRRRAVGTTVNAHVGPAMLALQRLVGFDWLLREKGHEVEVDVSWQLGAVPGELADVLDVEPGADCCVLEKLYSADGDLAIWVRDYVPWAHLRSEPDGDVPPSLFEFSARHANQPIDHALVQIAPMVKRDEDSTRLQIPVGDAFTRLHERHISAAGEVVAYSVIDVDDNFIRFEVFRRASR